MLIEYHYKPEFALACSSKWLCAAMTKKVVGAKIACLDFSLNKAKMKLGVQVLIDDPSKLEGIRQR